MFCPKCGNEIAEGSAFCGKRGAPVGAQAGGSAPVGGAQGAASGSAGAGAPTPKRNGAKIGAIAAVVVVALVLVAGFATNWFGLAGVQPKEAVEVPAASQGADEAQGANAADGQSADANESAGDAQGGSQDATGAAVKSAVEAYTWDELSRISAEIGAAGDEAAAIEVAKKYNLCTPEGKLDGTQVKSVALADGTQTTVQIVGFAHDDKTAGGKAGITFIFGDCVGEAPMNSTDTNAGGWEASQMRAYLNGDWRTQLPQDLDAVIVPVDKLSNNVGETDAVSAVTTTSDALWLFSLSELAGAVPAGRTGEGYGLLRRAMWTFWMQRDRNTGFSATWAWAWETAKMPASLRRAQTRTLSGGYVPRSHATGTAFCVSTNTDIHLRDPTVLAAQITWFLAFAFKPIQVSKNLHARDANRRKGLPMSSAFLIEAGIIGGPVGKERIRMGFLDNVTSAVNRRTAAAGRGADKIKLNARIGELNKQRQGLAAQLGTSLYEAAANEKDGE